MNHAKVEIAVADSHLQEMLIARLAEIGFDGFEEGDESLAAYIESDKIQAKELDLIVSQYDLSYSLSIIEKQNWNALWESNFDPVRVDDFVGVRANFHPPFTGVEHEIVITPKMSFGTGHHATTYSVMQLMQALDFQEKSVFDFGTGTGILAILAKKLGAVDLLAVDNDEWCVENASENISINNCKHIDIQLVNHAGTNRQFDIVIANINKNIILDNIAALGKAVVSGGQVLLSGLLIEDEDDILTACTTLGWKKVKTVQRGAWIAIWLQA